MTVCLNACLFSVYFAAAVSFFFFFRAYTLGELSSIWVRYMPIFIIIASWEPSSQWLIDDHRSATDS